MKIKKIAPKHSTEKKRVAAYCRVSTLQDQQEESFETQKAYYSEFIQAHPDWVLTKIYADRHSGTDAAKRPGFQEMLAAAEKKQIDIVLCKSISRFARNVVDCQQYVKWFRTLGITIFFEEQNIQTDDPTCDFVLSMMAAVAQDESHSISRNIQAAYESRYARGEYNLGNNRILGYDCRKGKLVPNDEAWIVREIFKRFLAGQNYTEIVDALEKMGAKSKRGKKRFSVETLRNMLTNETYVGDKRLQKQPPKDYLTKKPDPNREYKTYYLKDDHEPLIDRETWDKVQEILNKREEEAKIGIYRTNGEHHELYGKIFCGECGAPFVRRTFRDKKGNHYKSWNCRERQKGSGCVCHAVREERLMEMTKGKDYNHIMVYEDRVEVE